MPCLKKRFGNNLRHLRLRRGLTQEQLAERLGLTCHSISNMERGIHAPRFRTLERLVRVLAADAAELFLARGDEASATCHSMQSTRSKVR